MAFLVGVRGRMMVDNFRRHTQNILEELMWHPLDVDGAHQTFGRYMNGPTGGVQSNLFDRQQQCRLPRVVSPLTAVVGLDLHVNHPVVLL